jgi:Rhamnan synthesis protein F
VPTREHPPRLVRDIGNVRVERQQPGVTAAVPDRVALMAAYSPTARVSRSAAMLVAELQRHGYAVLLCSTSADPEPLSFPELTQPVDLDRLTVLRRPNIGYDFGSWSVLTTAFPQLLAADKVLMVNDSLAGPFTPLTEAIEHFESSSADVWGLVESGQMADHLQSFFRGFRFGSLAEPPMLRYWNDIEVIDDKLDLIARYELGFSDFLRRHHFTTDCYVDFRGVVSRQQNPMITGWRRLLVRGIPFVKRELLRRPELVPDGSKIPHELRRRYDVEVEEWL